MLIVKIFCVIFLGFSFLCYLSDDWAIEPSWGAPSYSFTVVKRPRLSFKWRLVQWTALLVLPIIIWILQPLEPFMKSGNWNLQPPLEIWTDPLVKEYEHIFSFFDFSVLPHPKRGPKRNTLDVYAKVFLIKVHQKIEYSSELREFFFEHPQ